MFGKSILLSAVLVGTMAGCAQPKYESAPTNPTPIISGKDSPATCTSQFQPSGNCLTWSWDKEPTESAKGSLNFKISRPNLLDGTPVVLDPPGPPNLLLWMPGMGHGSTPALVSRFDLGTYQAAGVFFVMPGQWQLKFQVKVDGKVIDEAVVAITR